MTSKLTYSYLLAIIIFFSSCSAAYKMGQTPDDVYYSPAPPEQDGYVTSYTEEDQNSYAYNNQNVEDLAIRRGISDPIYRSSLSFGYGYMPYNYFDYPFMNPYGMFNPYSSFYPYNYYYPYTAGITFYPYNYFNYYGGYYPGYNYYSGYNYYAPNYYGKTSTTGGNYGVTPRRANLNAYRPNTTTRTTTTTTRSDATTAPVRTFTQQQRRQTSGFGGFVRRVFTPANNNNGGVTNNNSNNVRTFRPEFSAPTRSSGGNTGGSNSGSGGGGGSVRTFRH